MAKEELMIAEGVVHKVEKDARFTIKVGENLLLGTLCGALRTRRFRVKLVVNDRVTIKISPYDLTRCIIVNRVKTK